MHCWLYSFNFTNNTKKEFQFFATPKKLAEKLAQIAPGKLKRSFFTNSGTEANETAITTAQAYAGSSEILALRHSYSGRSILTMSLTGNSAWKLGHSISPGIHHAHAPYCYRCPFKLTYPACDCACANDIEELILTETSGKRLAAFIAEPIMGVGGFIVPPDGYFQRAVEIARKYGGLFIADEVQTGWGRTGKHWFGIEHYGVIPDIITAAKGFGNGFPIGLTLTTDKIAASLKGATISTFGGNPISTTAALSVIEYIERENLIKNAEILGSYFMDGLMALQEKYKIIGDVRGRGLMIGLEIVGENKKPLPEAVDYIFEATKKEGILIGRGGLYSNVIRLAPPLNVSKTEIDEALRRLDRAFEAFYSAN